MLAPEGTVCMGKPFAELWKGSDVLLVSYINGFSFPKQPA